MPQIGATVALANIWLDILRGVPWVGPLIALQLHTGHPGLGSANAFGGASRVAASYNAASGGSMSLIVGPTFTITAGGSILYVTAWTGLSGDPDAFCFATGRMVSPVAVANGDLFNLASCPIAFDPDRLAAA